MICPNCGTEQPESFECVNCGIVFAKYEERQAKLRAGLDERRRQRWKSPLGPATRIMRLIVGLASVGLAVLMFLSGTAIMSFGPFVAFVFFLGAGLYFFVSFKERIHVWRFALESAILAAMSLVICTSLPEVFSLGRPMYSSTIKVRPPNEARRFLDAAFQRLQEIRTFIEKKEFDDAAEAMALARKLHDGTLKSLFQKLPEKDRERLDPVYSRLMSLQPLLSTLETRLRSELPKGPSSWLPSAVSLQVEAFLDHVEDDCRKMDAVLTAEEKAVLEGVFGRSPPAHQVPEDSH